MSDVRIVHNVAQRGTVYTFERTSLFCLTRAITCYYLLDYQLFFKLTTPTITDEGFVRPAN